MLKIGTLDLQDLDKPYTAIVQLRTQPQGVVHQVVLRPDKVKRTGRRSTDALIRLGETQGDEASGWVNPQNIIVMAVLGRAEPETELGWKTPAAPWMCIPLDQKEAA